MHPMADHYRYLLSKGRLKAVPEWFHTRPQPKAENIFWWAAFWELSSERLPGMGISPIPGHAIRAYIRDHDLDEDIAGTLTRVVRTLDTIFMKLAGKRPTGEDGKPLEDH